MTTELNLIRFSDEQDHFCRAFSAAWPSLGLSAMDVAGICQRLLRRLVLINPAYAEVGFGFNPQLLPNSDRLKILDLSAEELAGSIERGRRTGLPGFPERTGRSGYGIVLGAHNMSSSDPRMISLILQIGNHRDDGWDGLEVALHKDSPAWHNPDLALGFIDDLIEITACHCAAAWAYILGEPVGYWRPWMTWLADNAGSPLPEIFQLDYERPPEQITRHKGGALQTWD